MNDTSNESQKTTVIKTLAIIGFIVALVFVAWLAVQAVRLAPVAFKTLASIADGLKRDNETEFTIATGASIINTGETLTISWTKPNDDENKYVFSYQCTDGVTAEIRESTGATSTVACDTEVLLTQQENSLAVTFFSEKSRFVDVPYTIGFGASGENKREGLITVVNPEISAHDIPNEDTDNISGATPDLNLNTGVGDEPPVPAPASTQPIGHATVPVVVTTIPVSNPNGYTDLAVTFVGIGVYNTDTEKFTVRSFLDEDERGALRFEVKNIGTKTSATWYFSATLPTNPSFTYSSSANAALKPNERQIITLQFDTVSGDSDERIVVAVTGGNDTILTNNSFTKQIEIRD